MRTIATTKTTRGRYPDGGHFACLATRTVTLSPGAKGQDSETAEHIEEYFLVISLSTPERSVEATGSCVRPFPFQPCRSVCPL
ncbi:hypothetical protein CGGC5_v001325 [Colletotrichum fructicola Nara gc5]|uniref:Uncharacterized protein n=1 Tax=Colletotrichum fructicola (strain Nara gc5) TaxID=1213859 RepID=A0A7J6JNC2_COLFN|nr:hypothetical protein CGGC5_v001325 [Colletotrichum fructicola Nara gc5]